MTAAPRIVVQDPELTLPTSAAQQCGMGYPQSGVLRALVRLPFGELLVNTTTAGLSASKSCYSHLAGDIETRPLAFLHAIDGTEGALDDR
jgi:hypothetical protein